MFKEKESMIINYLIIVNEIFLHNCMIRLHFYKGVRKKYKQINLILLEIESYKCLHQIHVI